tara:strand:+ start:333 stop:539 length:207 start_codon:yes stop_codon:yes gene_type:complete
MIANNPNENSYSPFERIEVLEQQVKNLTEATVGAFESLQSQLGMIEALSKEVASNMKLLKKIEQLLED